MTRLDEPLYGAEAKALRDRLREHHLTSARELISALGADDGADVRTAYRLLGRAECVIESLVRIIEGDVR